MTKRSEFLEAGKELEQFVSDYIENKITMDEIARKIGKTRSFVSFAFNNNIYPNPTDLRTKYREVAYPKVAKEIEKGMSVEDLVNHYPFLKNKNKIKRLIRDGLIDTKFPVFTKREKAKNELKGNVKKDFENGATIPELMKKYSIPRGFVTSIFVKEYGEASYVKARKVVSDKKQKQR